VGGGGCSRPGPHLFLLKRVLFLPLAGVLRPVGQADPPPVPGCRTKVSIHLASGRSQNVRGTVLPAASREVQS